MRRFTIARLMIVVAFLGANFGVLRFLLSPSSRMEFELLAGFLPLADALFVAIGVVASRHRVALRWMPRSERGRLAPGFVAFCGLFLVASVVACLAFPNVLIEYIEVAGAPIDRGLRSLGVLTDQDTPLVRFVIAPVFLGLLFSGPPLLVAAVMAFLMSRFTIVITPRTTKEDAPCDGSAS